jgi:hypothetical protein
LTLWEGKFEGLNYTWLRWCDEAGNLLLTGDELAQKTMLEKKQQTERAENAENELEKLKEKLRQQDVNLD